VAKNKKNIQFALLLFFAATLFSQKSYGQCSGIDFKANIRSGCALLVVQFSATGTSSSAGTKFQWDVGNGFVTGSDTITKGYPSQGKYTITMKATLSGGTTCTVKKDTFISVLANPVPVLNYNAGSTICDRAGTEVTFTDNTQGSASRKWIIEGGTYTTKSVSHIFANATNQTITLQVTNKNTCSNTAKKTISVYDSIPLDYCAKFTVKPTSVTGIFSPIVPLNNGRKIAGYLWQFPGGSPSSSKQSNPTVVYPDPSKKYDVYLTVIMDDSCTYTRKRSGFVSPFLTPAFKSLCVNAAIPLSADITDTGRHNYTFSFPNASLVKLPDRVPDPKTLILLYNKVGDYEASITYTYAGNSCRVSVYYPFFVEQMGPHADFDSKDSRLCAPFDTTHFINKTDILGAPDVQYIWKISTPNNKLRILGPTSSRDTFYVPGLWGEYSVTLLAKSSNGCTDSVRYNGFISVANPKVTISHARNQCFGNLDTLTCIPSPFSVNSYNYRWHLWNVADSSDSTSGLSRKLSFYQSILGTYSATVDISNGKCHADTTESNVITVIGDDADFAISKTSGCLDPDFQTTLSLSREKYFPKANPPVYHWRVESTYADAVTFLSPFAKTTKAVFTKAGCYDIMLDIITVLGKDTCRQEITKYKGVCVGLQTYFEPQVLKCKNDTIVMLNYTDTDAVSMKWTIDPPGLAIIIPYDTSRNVKIIFKKDTCYNVKLVAAKPVNGEWCKDSTIKNICIGPPLPSFFTKTPKIYCAPSIAQFQSTSSKNAAYYLWNFGDGDSLVTSSDTTVAHVYQNFNQTTYNISLTAFDKYGCSNTLTRTSLIQVTGPVPHFTMNQNIACDSITVKFTNTSSKVKNFIFLYDDGSPPLINIDPGAHTYRLQDPGLDSFVFYPVLLSKDDTLCKVFFQDAVKVYRRPVDAKVLMDVKAGCSPLTVHFNAVSRGANSWKWDFDRNGSVDATQKNTSYTFQKPGKYVVKLTAGNSACSFSVYSDTIIVSANAKADFSPSAAKMCGKSLISFKNLSSGYSRFVFDYGDGSLKDNDVMADHIYYYNPSKDSGDSVVFFPAIKLYNAGGCSDSFKSRIVAYHMPVAGFKESGVTGCSPLNILFIDTSTNRFASQWDFDNDGTIDAFGQLTQNIFPPGIYSIKLRSVSKEGCIDSLVKVNMITVNDPPKADFKVSDSDICFNTKVHFTNLTWPFQEVKTWKWKFNEPFAPFDTSSLKDPDFIFYSKGTHTIELTAIDSKGCEGTIRKQVVFVEDTVPPKNSSLLYVSVNDTHKVEISWKKNVSPRITGYQINRIVNGKPVMIHSTRNTDDTLFQDNDTLLNTSRSAYCYSVQAVDACNMVSFASYSHCTILLSGVSNPGAANILTWSSYVGWAPKCYRIYRSAGTGNFTLIDSVKANVLTYTDTALCDGNYCYFVQAVKDSGFYASRSNSTCLNAQYTRQIKPVNLRYVTVENNRDIRIAWDTINYKNLAEYTIDKYSRNKGWVYHYASASGNSFIDRHVDINDSSYSYKIKTIDNCGYEGPVSNNGSSILLREKIQQDKIVLRWNAYHSWPAGVKSYKIQILLKDYFFKTIAQVSDTFYTDDSVYQSIDTAYCYRVIAFENAGRNDSSISNQTCAVLPSRIFVPNAFTPGNGDSLNDQWKISAISLYNAAGTSIKNFNVRIFNRWGTLIFESNDLNKGWDGTFRGVSAPADVYIYIISAEGIDSRNIEINGNLTLIR
jgi:gliding motility-associated-like protein